MLAVARLASRQALVIFKAVVGANTHEFDPAHWATCLVMEYAIGLKAKKVIDAGESYRSLNGKGSKAGSPLSRLCLRNEAV